jgi:hypothetical protein
MSVMTSLAVEARGEVFRVPRTVVYHGSQLSPATCDRRRRGLSFYAVAWSFSMANLYCPLCGRHGISAMCSENFFACFGCRKLVYIEQPKTQTIVSSDQPTPLFESAKLLDEVEQILTDCLQPKGVS